MPFESYSPWIVSYDGISLPSHLDLNHCKDKKQKAYITANHMYYTDDIFIVFEILMYINGLFFLK